MCSFVRCLCPRTSGTSRVRKITRIDTDYPINVYQSQYSDDYVKRNKNISELADSYAWDNLIEAIKGFPEMINACKYPTEDSDPPELLTPLHQAANGSAPKQVFEELLKLGASKTLKTAKGETSYDIANRLGLSEDILKLIQVPKEVIENNEAIHRMETGLHEVINERMKDLIVQNGQSLPQLAYLYEFGTFHYPVPGMYGGFSVSRRKSGIQIVSFIRICGGSGQFHFIDRAGKVTLEQEGFY